MILTKVTISRHGGCWVSDASASFPLYSFRSMMINVQAVHSAVNLLIVPMDGKVDLDKELEIVGSLSRYRVAATKTSTAPNGVGLYSIEARDVGQVEEVIRLLARQSEYRKILFPEFQTLTAENGREECYFAANSKASQNRIGDMIGLNVGKKNMTMETLDDRVQPREIPFKVPCFFDEIFDRSTSELIKDVLSSSYHNAHGGNIDIGAKVKELAKKVPNAAWDLLVFIAAKSTLGL